ncbi:NUDIX domain-containing protein [Streptomyces platensis]|uniref:NUDIX domain-containing protein n=1 Tax=Streptomyces platensis TaxID=58346 RepID=UPI0037AC59DD
MAVPVRAQGRGQWPGRAHGAQRARDPRVGHRQCVHPVWHGGFVLGVIEPGESREQALVRGVRQELGIALAPGAPGLRHAGHGARPRPRQHRVRGWTWCVVLCSVCPWSRRSCLLGEAGLLSRLGGMCDEGLCVAGDTAPQVGREVGQ